MSRLASVGLVVFAMGCEGPQGPPGDDGTLPSPTPVLAANVQYTTSTGGTASVQTSLNELEAKHAALSTSLADALTTYCNPTGVDDGIVGTGAGGWAEAMAVCQAVFPCGGGGHVCTYEEVVRSRNLGIAVGSGWIMWPNSCSQDGFTPYNTAGGSGTAFDGSTGAVTNPLCNTTRPYLCCF